MAHSVQGLRMRGIVPIMDAKLFVDSRERAVIEKGGALLGDFVAKPLDVGDFHIVDPNTANIVLGIERKTIGDFISSIHDGRYHEQKCRAMETIGRGRFLYMCEVGGEFTWRAGEAHEKQVRSAIVNTMLRDGVPVFFTQDVHDSCALVRNILDKVREKGGGFYTAPGEIAYKSCFLQPRRRDNVKDPRTVAELQLAQIPGISLRDANSILDALGAKTLPALFECIKSTDSDSLKRRLLSLDGIGKKKADALLMYLLH
jgi:ERCC4-type nuclease